MPLIACVVMSCVLLLTACSSTPTRAPVSETAKKPAPKRSAISIDSKGYYRVKSGDTLYAISLGANKSVTQVASWNGLKPPYTIYPGQKLRVTGPSPTSSKNQTTPKTNKKNNTSRSGSSSRKKSSTSSTGASSSALSWQWPTKGKVIEHFKKNDEVQTGIEIQGREGQQIVAAAGGKIVYSGNGLRGYGRLIIIKHDKNYLSAYGHNRKLLVKEGEKVKKGQVIAEMGADAEGKQQLHFEIRRQGIPVNPLGLLPK